jgi:hypothetical protein
MRTPPAKEKVMIGKAIDVPDGVLRIIYEDCQDAAAGRASPPDGRVGGLRARRAHLRFTRHFQATAAVYESRAESPDKGVAKDRHFLV